MGLLDGFTKLLGNTAHNVQQTAGNAVNGVVKGVQKELSNPASILLGAIPGSQAVRAVQSTINNLPSMHNNVQPKQNLLDAQHAFGTLVTQNTADQQGYSPSFRSLVQRTNPAVYQPGGFDGPQGSAGYYQPQGNRIALRSNAVDPYTITHEGLHAAYQGETPQQHQAFAQLISKATPQQLKRLNGNFGIGNELYKQGTADSLLNETHSFLPMYNQGGQSPALSDYYKQYFSNPQFYDKNLRTKYKIAQSIGGYPQRTPNQFDSWGD